MTDIDPASQPAIAPLWRLAFRAGFLAAGIFAVLGMARWLFWILQPGAWHGTLSPHWWHAHEMVFGFAMPVVAGFLLTAVATWTGLAGTRGRRLQLLFGLWLLARLLLWLLPQWQLAAWLAETVFILCIAFELGIRVWPRRQWRNMLFIPVLLILALLNSASHWSSSDPLQSARLHDGALWMLVTLVAIVGGRVIPLFTGNRLMLDITPLPMWFEVLAVASVLSIGLIAALWPSQQTPWLSMLCLAAGTLHLYRLARWQGWRATGVPLLWSMHLSYLCIPVTLLGLGLIGMDPVAGRHLLHLLAIGAVGGMILAMMSRVSLGHTGRPLEVPAFLAWAFALLIFAALVRALLPIAAASFTTLAWRVSAALWILAFGSFVYRYLPILTRAREDGKFG